jgi:hypothetical protein
MPTHRAPGTGRAAVRRGLPDVVGVFLAAISLRICPALTRQLKTNGNVPKSLKTKESDMHHPSIFGGSGVAVLHSKFARASAPSVPW